MEFCSVETASGRVQGLISSGIRQFKGVSYGASTAGANRFQGPKPAKPWTGVRDCLGYAAVSPQVPYDVGHEYARLIQFDLNVALGGMGEDCLHLNIWTPGTGRQDKRAVLFCIHGGGWKVSTLLGMPAAQNLFLSGRASMHCNVRRWCTAATPGWSAILMEHCARCGWTCLRAPAF
jgi:carboxylesterase type B